jgi:predicted methyltransferase
MKLPEKYKEKFDVSSEDPSSGVTYIFQVVSSLPTMGIGTDSSRLFMPMSFMHVLL